MASYRIHGLPSSISSLSSYSPTRTKTSLFGMSDLQCVSPSSLPGTHKPELSANSWQTGSVTLHYTTECCFSSLIAVRVHRTVIRSLLHNSGWVTQIILSFKYQILCKFPELVHTWWISVYHRNQFCYYRLPTVVAVFGDEECDYCDRADTWLGGASYGWITDTRIVKRSRLVRQYSGNLNI